MYEGVNVKNTEPGSECVVTFEQKMDLQGGEYLLSFGCTGYLNGEFTVFHRLYDACNITVVSTKNTVGFYDISYFSRLFKKETGYSPHEYVIQARVNAAKYFLQSARLSQKDICYSCGFSSESSFCTTFKKATGLTPSQYRKNVSSERWIQE